MSDLRRDLLVLNARWQFGLTYYPQLAGVRWHHTVRLVALVRGWGKDVIDLQDFIARWNAFRDEYPFDKVILVIDEDKDGGKTQGAIEELDSADALPDWLFPVFVAGCGTQRNWSPLLNAGLCAADLMGLQNDSLVLVSSFEAVARGEFGSVFSAVNNDTSGGIPMIGIRKTLPSFYTSEMEQFLDQVSTRQLTKILTDVRSYISGKLKSDTSIPYFVSLLKLFGRNTMQLWRRYALKQIGDFDCRCDLAGGQEDLMALLMIELRDPGALSEAFKHIFEYDDSRVSAGQKTHLDETQKEKADREDAAILWVLNELRRICRGAATDGMSVNEEIHVPCTQFPQHPTLELNW